MHPALAIGPWASRLAERLGHRDFLFFSDTAGFRWLVDTNRQRAAASKR